MIPLTCFPGQRLVKKHWVLIWKLVGYTYNFLQPYSFYNCSHSNKQNILFLTILFNAILLQFQINTQKKNVFTILFNTVSKKYFHNIYLAQYCYSFKLITTHKKYSHNFYLM